MAPMAPVAAPMLQIGINAGWRCVHGAANPPPSMPELAVVDEAGYALVVQWPSVNHATAYVVELREPGALRAERFVRAVPQQGVGSLIELRVGGLRPAGPGCCYVAQVRSVAPCGCESELSQAAVLTTGAAPAPAPAATRAPAFGKDGFAISLADACSPPAATCRGTYGFSQVDEVPEKMARTHQMQEPPMPPACYGVPPMRAELPSLLGRMSPVGSPMGPPASMSFGMAMKGAVAPEVAGHEHEECIFLD